ncbi:unnamed protein product [Prunus armeniaca]
MAELFKGDAEAPLCFQSSSAEMAEFFKGAAEAPLCFQIDKQRQEPSGCCSVLLEHCQQHFRFSPGPNDSNTTGYGSDFWIQTPWKTCGCSW